MRHLAEVATLADHPAGGIRHHRADRDVTRPSRVCGEGKGAIHRGEVRGIIAPDRKSRMRLVSATGLGGLEASNPPSPASIPNNHLFYAIQWFLFAGIAALIYGLALRKRWRQGDAP